MKVTRKKAVQNRKCIVETASRLFRERGFDGVGVDAIMQAAGLTHGGFYNHFASKDDLAAEAAACALAAGAENLAGVTSLQDLVRNYLSSEHRDNRANGCAMAALGGEIARQKPEVRKQLAAHVSNQIDWVAKLIGGKKTNPQRARAIRELSELVGALILARAVSDRALSDEILEATRKART